MTTPRTSPSQKQKLKLQEKTRLQAHAKMLEARAATLVAKIAEVQDELEYFQAYNYHLFTVVFADGQVALCEVWGARDVDAACRIAHETVYEQPVYEQPFQVIKGDHTGGKAQIVYHRCCRLALEANDAAIRRHIFPSGLLRHIVVFGDETLRPDALPC